MPHCIARIGDHTQISHAEIATLAIGDIHTTMSGRCLQFVALDDQYHRLQHCGSLIKAGRLIEPDDLAPLLATHTLIGTNDKTLGKQLKKQHDTIKRFKLVEPFRTDAEIKRDGIEIVTHGDALYHIDTYQPINLYEAIEFDKPVRSMKSLGMMPASLAQTMITLGTHATHQLTGSYPTTVYDPFAGTGTTCWLAHARGYDTIGSDINIAPAKQNRKRRLSTDFASEHKCTCIKHDVTTPFDQPIMDHVRCIVTEGYLGARQRGRRSQHEIDTDRASVSQLYSAWLSTTASRRSQICLTFTLPLYPNDQQCDAVFATMREHGYTATIVGTYKKSSHRIGRQLIIATRG